MLKKSCEKITVDKAKYLLSLSESRLLCEIWNNDELENGEWVKLNKCEYVKQFIKYAKLMISFKGEYYKNYNFSKNLLNCGRQYVEGFGIQSMTASLRGFLVSGIYNDYDMINAHPSILLYLVEKHIPEINFKYLKKYVINRDFFLSKEGITKHSIIKDMNSSKVTNNKNPFMRALDKEFKQIQDIFFNKTPEGLKCYENFKALNKQNAKGSFMNIILTIYESNILQNALKEFKTENIGPLSFDGCLLDVILDIQETIKILNKSSECYKYVKWIMKPHSTKIKIDEGIEILEDEDLLKTYENIKAKFEKNHLMIESPVNFIREGTYQGKPYYTIYGKEDFKTLTAPFKYINIMGKEVNLFNRWAEDENRRSYKKLDFIPKKNHNELETYNTFSGFDYADYHLKQIDEQHAAIKLFTEHINILTNDCEESTAYLIKYLAHLIQKTAELPAVCILFKSKQGYGKDLFIDIIQKMLGKQYLFRTAKPEEIFGDFTTSLKDKIILQLNELEGKDGFHSKEKIKNLITEEQTNINEKKVKAYKQTNYLRVFICSNNLTPIEIPHDDRRFIVFKARNKKPKADYFKTLVTDVLNNDESLYALYKYFNEVDISDFDIRNHRPITPAYKEMMDAEVNPLYKYLYETFSDEEYKSEFEDNYKESSNNNIYVKTDALLNNYKEYLVTNEMTYIKINYKLLKLLLSNIGILNKQIRADNTKWKVYIINKEIINNLAEEYDLEEEILEDIDFIN